MSKIRLGVVMDAVHTIQYQKDSTLAMLWEAAARGYELYYFEQSALFLQDSIAFGEAQPLRVQRNPGKWYSLGEKKRLPLAELDVILMRKDPPFNEEYIYTTYILEQAQREGVLVVNRPQSLRDANEKLFATLFPQCLPPTLVTQSISKLYAFWQVHEDIVCKPLNNMGGANVFRLQKHDVNANVIFAALVNAPARYVMAQRFIPEITQGDKRILMINGEAVSFALARVPGKNDWRGNLAAGASARVQPLSERDQFICEQVGPELRARGLIFVGLDIIGNYLTEINVTSPTGIRQIDESAKINVSAQLFDVIEQQLNV